MTHRLRISRTAPSAPGILAPSLLSNFIPRETPLMEIDASRASWEYLIFIILIYDK